MNNVTRYHNLLTSITMLGLSVSAYGQTVSLDSLQPTAYTQTPKANVILTMDDSGSMLGKVNGASSPVGSWGDEDSTHIFDAYSYQPQVLYEIPPNLDGSLRTDLDLIGPTQGYIDPYWGDMGNLLGGTLTKHAGSNLPSSQYGSNIEDIFNSEINIYWKYSMYYGNTSPLYNAKQPFRVGTWTPPGLGVDPGDGPVIPRCPAPPVLTGYAADVVAANASGAGIDASLETLSGQQANCRVWWTYYKSRQLSLKSALIVALLKQDLSKVRLSWQFLGENQVRPVLPLINLSESSNQGFKDMMLNIFNQTFSNGTPLTAAAYRGYEALSSTSPAVNDPYRDLSVDGTTPGELQSCRQSYQILMTDGDWNTAMRCDALGTCATIKDYSRNNSIAMPTPDPSITPLKIPLPASAVYSSANNESHLYRTENSSTKTALADLALHYWARDIRTDLINDVSQYVARDTNETFTTTNGSQTLTPFWNYKNDPAVWQHVVTYGITFGPQADNFATAPSWALTDSGATNQEDYDEWALAERIRGDHYYLWWENSGSGSANDVKHAAYNGRGEYFSANTSSGLVDAFDKIFANIIGRTSVSRATGAAVPKASAGDEELYQLYVSEFDPSTFDGKLKALKLYDGDEANYASCFGSSSDPRSKGELCDNPIQENWEASYQMSLVTPAVRKVITRDTTVTSFSAISFDTALPLPIKQEIDNVLPVAELDAIIDYIRGDNSNELANGGTYAYRDRSSRLGDVGRSSIVFSKEAALLAGHMDIDTTVFNSYYSSVGSAYADGIVYVGANDGMLHAFNARTGDEVFAYIPSSLLSKLPNLTKIPYVHTAYVDGKITIKDVDLDGNNGSWSRVLVAGLGAGGKGLFALDVTDPTNPQLLWEINETTVGLENIVGKITGEVVITQLEPYGSYTDGRWVAITGNGYQSGVEDDDSDDVASLLVIDLETGDLVSQITPVEAAPAVGISVANGLGEVAVIDEWYGYGGGSRFGRDYRADMAYAGDLQGNLWKFDLRKLASAPLPLILPAATPGKTIVHNTLGSDYIEHLFKAQNISMDGLIPKVNQPITAAVEVLKHPTGQGNLVYVGTGALFATNDISSEVVNGFYAVWDNEFYDPTSSKGVIDRLRLRPIELDTIAYSGTDYYRLTPGQLPTKWANEVFAGLTSTSDPNEAVMGWFVDFSELGGGTDAYRSWQRPYLTKAANGEELVGILPSYLSPPVCNGADNKSSMLLFSARDGSQSLNVASLDLNDDSEINADDLTVSLPSGISPQQLMGQQLEGLIYNPAISSGTTSLEGSKNKTDCDNWQSTYAGSSGGLDVSNVCVAKYIGSWLEIIK